MEMVSLKPGISLNLSDYKRTQDAQQQDMKNMGHGSYRILGKKTRTFQGPKSFFQGLLFPVFDIE